MSLHFNLLFLLIAGLATGLSQVINKKLATNNYDSATFTTVIMLTNAFISTPLLLINFHLSTSLFYWSLIIVSIVFFALSTFFSFKAYKHSDVSTVSIFQRLNILFVALIGIFLLHEAYTVKSVIGLLFISAGALVLVFNNKQIQISIGIIFAILMALFGAGATVLDKIILNDFSPYTYVFVNNLLVGSVFLFRKQTLVQGKKLLSHQPQLIFLTSFFTTISFLLVLLVLQQTKVSQTMPVYKSLSLITPVLLGIFILKEKQKLSQKLIGTTLGIIGITLQY